MTAAATDMGRIGEDREGFLEALEVVVADQDRCGLAVARERHAVVLILYGVSRACRWRAGERRWRASVTLIVGVA
jgi:hypothetical protein